MRKAAVFLVPALVTLLVGCQAIFTFSPLSGSSAILPQCLPRSA